MSLKINPLGPAVGIITDGADDAGGQALPGSGDNRGGRVATKLPGIIDHPGILPGPGHFIDVNKIVTDGGT